MSDISYSDGIVAAVHTAIVSLRDFIRQVLDLKAIPNDAVIPRQGPAQPSASRGGNKPDGGGADGARQGGGKGQGGGASAGAGDGLGMGIGTGGGLAHDNDDETGTRKHLGCARQCKKKSPAAVPGASPATRSAFTCAVHA